MDILNRNTQCLLTVIRKYAGIMNGIRHIRYKTIVLVTNNKCIGVLTDPVPFRNQGVHRRRHDVIVNVSSPSLFGQLFNSSNSDAELLAITCIDIRWQETYFPIVEGVTYLIVDFHLTDKDLMT